MGVLIQFPQHHARASGIAGARAFAAAKRAIASAVSPAFLAVPEAKIESHHSEGMRSRCPHLRTAATLAPTSSAIASGDGQSAMMSLNETITGKAGATIMPSPLGHLVLKSKANVSCDCEYSIAHNPDMPDRMSETEEKLAFIRRVRLAREARFETQKPMLTILGLDQGTYKQYETRTVLPHRFLPKFCAATGVELDWLLTGEGKGPEVAESPKQPPKRIAKARRGRAA